MEEHTWELKTTSQKGSVVGKVWPRMRTLGISVPVFFPPAYSAESKYFFVAPPYTTHRRVAAVPGETMATAQNK